MRIQLIAISAVAAALLSACASDEDAQQALDFLKTVESAQASLVSQGIDEKTAVNWYEGVYGVPDCPTPNDKSTNCDISTLLSARQVTLAPGTVIKKMSVDTSNDDVTWKVHDQIIEEPSDPWCFKAKKFQRLVYSTTDDAGNPEFSEKTTYDYHCYLLTSDGGNSSDLMAVHMGQLLPDGTIGLSEADNCFVARKGIADSKFFNSCLKEAELTTPPAW